MVTKGISPSLCSWNLHGIPSFYVERRKKERAPVKENWRRRDQDLAEQTGRSSRTRPWRAAADNDESVMLPLAVAGCVCSAVVSWPQACKTIFRSSRKSQNL